LPGSGGGTAGSSLSIVSTSSNIFLISCNHRISPPQISSRRSVPRSFMARRSSSIFCMARGDGRARPFSHRLMVGNVTPRRAANFSWVRPVRRRSSRMRRGMLAWAFNVGLLSDATEFISDDLSDDLSYLNSLNCQKIFYSLIFKSNGSRKYLYKSRQ